MKVAAYQAPLCACGSLVEALALIRMKVEWCESAAVEILCCPEGVLGGLADYAVDPTQFAIPVTSGQLDAALAPLASDSVTTIVGFTELGEGRRLYNSAAVFQRGSVVGLYRKLHPAINSSVYQAGREVPVFQVGALTFGIVICRDSTYAAPVRQIAAQGATALFIPTNNGLPPARAGAELVAQTRTADVATAVNNNIWVIRADVAGRSGDLLSYGTSGIVAPDGLVVHSAGELCEELIVAEISLEPVIHSVRPQ